MVSPLRRVLPAPRILAQHSKAQEARGGTQCNDSLPSPAPNQRCTHAAHLLPRSRQRHRQRHHPRRHLRAQGVLWRHRRQLLLCCLPQRRAHLQACVPAAGQARGAQRASVDWQPLASTGTARCATRRRTRARPPPCPRSPAGGRPRLQRHLLLPLLHHQEGAVSGGDGWVWRWYTPGARTPRAGQC